MLTQPMSSFGEIANINLTLRYARSSGHATHSPGLHGTWSAGQQFADVQGGNGGTSFIMNDRGDLGNKAGAALESHVAPQPSYSDYKTIPQAN